MLQKPWLPHYDPGVPEHIEYPPITIHGLLKQAAEKFPTQICTYFNGSTINYREMDSLSDKIAQGLLEIGLKKGERVGILLPNCPQFIMVYFAILKAGGVVSAINPLYKPREIEAQVKDSGAHILFIKDDVYEAVRSMRAEAGLEFMSIISQDNLLESSHDFHNYDLNLNNLLIRSELALPQISPNDVGVFQYSGGTTGISKAAVIPHRCVVANTYQFRSWMTTLKEGQEVFLLAIPLYHIYGMVVGMMVALNLGARMVLVSNPRDLNGLLEIIKRTRPTFFPGVPTMYNAINNHPDVKAGKYDLGSIKACISGSAPLLRDTKERFEKLTGGVVFEGYGLSEAPTATHCNPLLGLNKTGSIGLPLPDVDCRIINLIDGFTEMPVGETGELIINSPQVMLEYHHMPEESREALRVLPDGSGPWLFTGDIAHMDQDGYFFITDRKKDLIKPGGFQVWPREVEEVISAHPKVLEVGVAGIPHEYRGETVKAWVVVRPGEELGAEEVITWCRERLSHYKAPTEVEFRTELPRTPVGKLLRRELARQHRENLTKSNTNL